jgi:hypothetical protein
MMRCLACEIELDPEDNYCRKCGAPVRVVGAAAAEPTTAVVRVGPSTPALIATAARPLATGAAAVAAGALLRFAVRRAARGLLGSMAAGRPAANSRALVQRDEHQPSAGIVEITEVYRYRRIIRS